MTDEYLTISFWGEREKGSCLEGGLYAKFIILALSNINANSFRVCHFIMTWFPKPFQTRETAYIYAKHLHIFQSLLLTICFINFKQKKGFQNMFENNRIKVLRVRKKIVMQEIFLKKKIKGSLFSAFYKRALER